jgi:hypothetical protein
MERGMQTDKTTQARGAWLALGVALLALLAAGCPASGPPVIETDLIDTGLFKHSQHVGEVAAIRDLNGGKAMGCVDCHVVQADKDFEVQRPGSQQHAPCDRCHQAEYYKPPGDFCQICHAGVNPLKDNASPLEPYPRRAVAAQLVSAFNHEVHLAGERVKRDGRGLGCADCHQVEGKDAAYASFPKHGNCAPCHAQVVSPQMQDCDGCHAANGPGKARNFIQNDIRFTHGKHQLDKAGQPIPCETCHYGVKNSSSSRDLNLPLMRDCAKCHEDKSKTPDTVRIAQCGVCHTTDVESRALPGSHTAAVEREPEGWISMTGAADLELLALIERRAADLDAEAGLAEAELPLVDQMLADISGLVVAERTITTSERPDDHTPLFRFNHGEMASSPDAKCSYCHTGLSGSPRDSCRDCHATWKPRNHSIRWRGVEHGREAAVNAQRCATCHEVDFCTECHNIPPPNHSPLVTFRYNHGRLARFNARSCLTCHTFETTCVDCHVLSVEPVRVQTGGLKGRP